MQDQIAEYNHDYRIIDHRGGGSFRYNALTRTLRAILWAMAISMVADGNSTTQDGFAPVLAALSTLQGNIDRSQKADAHQYLEQFQKSVSILLAHSWLVVHSLTMPHQRDAWTTTHGILQSSDASSEAKLFAATTLKGKVRISYFCFRCHNELTVTRLPTTCTSCPAKTSRLSETRSYDYWQARVLVQNPFGLSFAFVSRILPFKCWNGKMCYS